LARGSAAFAPDRPLDHPPTRQLQHRLETTLPEGSAQYAPMTAAYEAERYGRLSPSADRAADLSRRLRQLET